MLPPIVAPEPFDAPYNWCDRQCERCSLPDTCLVALRDARRRWRREERGDDHDAWAAAMDDVHLALQLSQGSLQQVSDREAIELRTPRPPPATNLDAERLRRAGLRLVRCVGQLADSADRGGDAECLNLCLQLMGKTARVMSYLEDRFMDAWATDAVPNLLLIERNLDRLQRTLAALRASEASAALAALKQLLSPLLATVDDAARAQLSELIRSGRAPSPFLVSDQASP